MGRQRRPTEVAGLQAARLAALFPSFRDFVDVALFGDPGGYYGTGKVRFGYGGDYDTFPLALSPVFGRMVARYGFRRWRRAGEPDGFEFCELGAGNGQLCLDVLTSVAQAAGRGTAWARFAQAARYRIFERSPALRRCQQRRLGAWRRQVRWAASDLSARAVGRCPLAPCGLVVANEVLDCLAHHKVVSRRDGSPGVVFVVPVVPPEAAGDGIPLVPGRTPAERAVARAHLRDVLARESWRAQVQYEEVVLPLAAVPGLQNFLRRHYPEFFSGDPLRPYFACPAIEPLVANVARLYDECEILWIDYGDTRALHLGTPCGQRLFAGPPPSRANVYRAPGTEDITFMVDFSVLAEAAYRAGLRVTFFGPQAELARLSGVAIGDETAEEILCHRLPTLAGSDADHQFTGVETKSLPHLRAHTRRALAEFLGQRRSHFKLMIMRA